MVTAYAIATTIYLTVIFLAAVSVASSAKSPAGNLVWAVITAVLIAFGLLIIF
jgi:hypothetical protein